MFRHGFCAFLWEKPLKNFVIKPMESEDEINGKAYVHWKSWHETYPGLIDASCLEAFTLEKCVATAHRWSDNILVAKDGEKIVGFAGYGAYRDSEVVRALRPRRLPRAGGRLRAAAGGGRKALRKRTGRRLGLAGERERDPLLRTVRVSFRRGGGGDSSRRAEHGTQDAFGKGVKERRAAGSIRFSSRENF